MSNQPQNKRYKELLDELQLQSWQLELVISGFAIFGLISALEPLFQWQINLLLKGLYTIRFLVFGVYFACILTIINLIIHVLLRGLWIGAVGLRSVSGEIDFESLKFDLTITNYLKNKIGSFDTFIEKLETYSSIMFALTFLVIFMTLGVFINLVLLLGTIGFVIDSGLDKLIFDGFAIVLVGVGLLVIYLTIFLDFITRGGLKRIGGAHYLIFYRFTSILTLSVIYRPLLYNFWDNRFGKKLMLWLLPIYISGIFLFGSRYVPTHYLSAFYPSSEQIAYRRNYQDMVVKDDDYIGFAAIPSKTINTPYLELTIPYEAFLEEMMFEYDSTLIPQKSRVGLKNIVFEYFHWSLGDELPLEEELDYLGEVNNMLTVQIDSLPIKEPFVISKGYNNETSLKNFMKISNLKNGKHLLTIQRRTSKTDSTKLEHYETIPFWYFPD